MTDDEFKTRVIELLEIIAFMPEGMLQCDHDDAQDLGVMGDKPGQKMYCPECKQVFDRSGGNNG